VTFKSIFKIRKYGKHLTILLRNKGLGGGVAQR
jgi:hypothetical protein